MKRETERVQAAGVILYRVEGENILFLLLENARHGTWGFAKGHRDPGETTEEAARREVLEETGLSGLELLPGFLKAIRYRLPSPEEGLADKEVRFYLARAEEKDVVLSPEHAKGLWLDRDEAHRTLRHDTLREALHCAHEHAALLEGLPLSDIEEARALLEDFSEPGETWRRHSLEVGRVARELSLAVTAADPALPVSPSWTAAAGILHDIGRSRDQGIGHPVAGYRLLVEKGLERLAKPCISHWLKGRPRAELAGDSHFTTALLDELFTALDLETFTLSEQIVALADSLVMHDARVTVEDRYREAMKRYGCSPWMTGNLKISGRILEKIDAILGESAYRLLGIEE